MSMTKSEGDAALVDNRVLNPLRPRGRNPLTSIGNVARAGLAGLAIMGLGTAGAKEVQDPGSVSAPIAGAARNAGEAVANLVNAPTQEQKAAKGKWDLLAKRGDATNFVSLKVGQDGANVRNEPKVVTHTSSFQQDPGTRNEVVGKLASGTDVPKALPWEGLNPDRPGEKGTWYVVPLGNGRYGFSWNGNFEPRN